MRLILLIPSCWLLACLIWPAAPQSARRLWVLREPDEIVEYDAVSFAPKGRIRVPSAAIQNPERLSINGRGQMLFVPGTTGDEDDFRPGSAPNRVWFWNGRTSVQLDRGATRKRSRAGENLSVEETLPACLLSADGLHLFWFENEFRKLQGSEGVPDLSVTTVCRVWQSDLAGGQRRKIVEVAFAPCKCGTGVCSETCPEAELWAPDGVIDDFFLLTHWIPGQLGATFQNSFLHRKGKGSWVGSKLPGPLENLLDAARGGDILLSALPDTGCCGWDNDSNDRTLVISGGTATVLFDERERYANPNYDVSFFTSRALLSPDLASAAMTVVSSARPEGEIRLSYGGKPDSRELARIRQSVSSLPAVEACRLDNPSRRTASVPNAALAGWLNSQEILILENQVLVGFNIASGTRRDPKIGAPRISQVFLR
jgi:hypothetical protein